MKVYSSKISKRLKRVNKLLKWKLRPKHNQTPFEIRYKGQSVDPMRYLQKINPKICTSSVSCLIQLLGTDHFSYQFFIVFLKIALGKRFRSDKEIPFIIWSFLFLVDLSMFHIFSWYARIIQFFV